MDNPIINYRFAGIEIVHKSMEPMPNSGIGEQFFFDIKIEVKVSAEHKLVIPFVTVKIRGGDKQIEFANIGVSCLFEVQDFEKYILLDNKGKYTVPKTLETSIRPIAISTTRGVMYSEFRGTYLNNAVLPVVSLDTFKEEKK